MITRGLTAWLLATVLFSSSGYGHGGVGMVDNRCVLRIGPDLMFFTGYQPQSTREEFCDDIPTAGQTVVVLDMQDTELRDMLMEIRIIKDLGTHRRTNGLPVLTDAELASPEVLDPVTIAYVPAKKYPSGTLNFVHTFPDNGKFIGIVSVKNIHGQTYVSQFPFAVGQPLGKSLALYGMMIAGLFGTVYGLWYYGRTQKPHSQKKPA
ncbi:hypothetical protein QEV83_01615 [Methylocapsa sp. D3K7]|uniref:hypothetical protein n=1 Tax=Methylocapsa sp. D3K7 TaxID=3041435 RepID=UPI00244E9408|nr:hypothetical protein [Methylocapsa sp. D3K7]WGJ15033.1 hypothetical protein QEV83_01615 [Methylocapsa sp. D3K7]